MTLLDNITSLRRGAMTAVGGFAVTLCVWGFQALYGQAKDIAASVDALSAAMAATEAAVRSNANAIAANAEAIREVAGLDGIVRVEPGSAYIVEPVYGGEPFTLRFALARTQKGKDCDITGAEVRFKDTRLVPFTGTILSRLRNFGTTFEPAEIRIQPPDERLLDGRIILTIVVSYQCPVTGADGVVRRAADSDEIGPFIYSQIARPEP